MWQDGTGRELVFTLRENARAVSERGHSSARCSAPVGWVVVGRHRAGISSDRSFTLSSFLHFGSLLAGAVG